MTLDELKQIDDAPYWMDEPSLATLRGGYLLPDETPRQMYNRVAKAAASYYSDGTDWEKNFFDVMWNNWLCPASPILSNMGTNRGLPISCNSIHVPDSIDGIFMKSHELGMLSKSGAGVGVYLNDIRSRGTKIKGNGSSEGIIPWAKLYDTSVAVINQGGVRRGAAAVYLSVEHGDIEEFLNIRRPTGDMNRRCLNLNHGICISDDWMKSMLAGDKEKRLTWQSVLLNRVETGEPYLFFTDNVNSKNPECYTKNGLSVKTSNICCLSGDTLVLTSAGPEKIEALVDKTVSIWDGINWVENNTFGKRGEDELIRIYLQDGSFIDSNANHRWFAASNYTHIRDDKYELHTTNELQVGQWLESHGQDFHGEDNEKGAYLKGFLIGDGTHTKNRPLLNLHSTKYACIEELIVSGNELKIESENTNTITSIGFNDEITHAAGKYEGVYGETKYRQMTGLSSRKLELIDWTTSFKHSLPKNIFQWNKSSKLKFLSGLLDADGTVAKRNSIQIASIHKAFINDLQLLIKTFGYSANIDVMDWEDRNNLYRLTLSSFDSYELLSMMSCKRLKVNGAKPNRKLTGWRRITKIERLEGIHPVYCPTLPTTGKFALANGLMTGNTEIFLHTDPDHSFVCCLSSLNVARWDEWKDTDLPNIAARFLDAVIEEYIQKSVGVPGLEASRRSAIKGRAIGIGVLGWHTLLQANMIPFDSFESMRLNALIFKTIRDKAEEETVKMAVELGEPEWCKGFGRRNTHLMACAPTVSNSTISGGLSAGIEPLAANIYSQKSAKGTFIRKNPALEILLDSKGINTPEIWKSINEFSGSVMHLKQLSDEEKQVFLTAREINQHAIIKQAIQRQQFIDQGQSVNLFFGNNSSPKYIHEVHLAAWEGGLKSLYYCRAEGVIRGDLASRSKDECAACEG